MMWPTNTQTVIAKSKIALNANIFPRYLNRTVGLEASGSRHAIADEGFMCPQTLWRFPLRSYLEDVKDLQAW